MAVIIRPVDSATELASAFDVAGAQFDPVIDHSDQRRGRRDGLHVPAAGSDAQNPRRDGWPAPARHGRALLRAFEASAQRLGAARISLGAGAETGFYIRHGYQTMLLLQWVYDPGRFDSDVAALAAGPAKGMTWRRDSFGGVPQLFVDLDEPSPVVREQVQDVVCGAHVSYCMTKAISAQAGRGSYPPTV